MWGSQIALGSLSLLNYLEADELYYGVKLKVASSFILICPFFLRRLLSVMFQ